MGAQSLEGVSGKRSENRPDVESFLTLRQKTLADLHECRSVEMHITQV